MCDVNAYRYENGQEEFIMESVDKVVFNDTGVSLRNIFGKQKKIEGRIKEFSMVDHRMIFYILSPQGEKY